jgi:hypothetical protein
VVCSGGNLTPSGNRGKWETPQAEPRRLPSLPEESKFPQRKSTGYNQKQQSIRKQPLEIKERSPNQGDQKILKSIAIESLVKFLP